MESFLKRTASASFVPRLLSIGPLSRRGERSDGVRLSGLGSRPSRLYADTRERSSLGLEQLRNK